MHYPSRHHGKFFKVPLSEIADTMAIEIIFEGKII